MADLKAAIREMLARGMSREEVVESLKELGVENAEEMLNAATNQLSSVSMQRQAAASGSVSEVSLAPPVQPPVSMESMDAPKPPVVVEPLHSVSGGSDDKLDEAIALLKALAEVNKKILETNRDLLLRMK